MTQDQTVTDIEILRNTSQLIFELWIYHLNTQNNILIIQYISHKNKIKNKKEKVWRDQPEEFKKKDGVAHEIIVL